MDRRRELDTGPRDVWPTLEVVVTEVGPELAKRYDPETGLHLLVP